MPSSIQQLDGTTSKSIQASLLFPTLTSIVLELVHLSLNAKPASFIEVYITLAPEWQITCQSDVTDRQFAHGSHSEGSTLDYLSYLGVVDLQFGPYKHIEKAGNVIFSGLLDAPVGGSTRSLSSLTIRDIFRNLPVRRRAFSSGSFARSEVEKCRKALSVVILPYPSTRVTLGCTSLEHAGSRIVFDALKVPSLLARYESLFSIPAIATGAALVISSKERVTQTQVQVEGFVLSSLLSSRSHQHILFNGRLQDDSILNSQRLADLHEVVLQALGPSCIGSDRSDEGGRAVVTGRHYGYFLDIRVSKAEQLDRSQLDSAIRRALTEVLHAHSLLPSPKHHAAQSRTRAHIEGESPTKKLRAFNGVNVGGNICHQQDNCRHYSLDRAGLLREPTQAKIREGQVGWVREVLSSWKGMLHEDVPVERRISSLGGDRRCSPIGDDLEVTGSHTLQRSGLNTCRVIGQVDAKYISVVYNENTLVLVDQHAAHERVRLEAMLTQYLEDCMKEKLLEPWDSDSTGMSIDIPRHLGQSFKEEDTARALQFWGFDIQSEAEAEAHSTIRIDAVPDILKDRLSSEETLRSFILDLDASLEDELVRRRMQLSLASPAQENSKTGWLIALRHLPPPLLDLFNSIACRGAIMFNDPLTHAQCERLISQLSQTVFPFQCAHGRPTMVPISPLHSSHAPTSPIRWASLSD